MTVKASAPAVWAGTDYRRTASLLAAELHPPHAAVLAELPDRGHHASALGRAVAQLSELYAELTSYGWRLVQRPGADHTRATALLGADVDTVADVRGERAETVDDDAGPLKLEILGPVSLAAQLHLPGGEKVLTDHGARRDLADSLAAGLRAHLAHVRRAIAPQALQLVILEPDYARVRSGKVATASGYQRIPALSRDQSRALLEPVIAALRTAGADEVLLDFGRPFEAEQAEDFRGPGTAAVEGFALPIHHLGAEDWQRSAELVETGGRLQASLLVPTEITSAVPQLPQVTQLAERIAQPWKRLGMRARSLNAFSVTALAAAHRGRMTQLSEPSAMAVLTRLLGTAEALTDAAHQ